MQITAGPRLTGLLATLVLQATVAGQSPAGRPLATVDGVAIAKDDLDALVGSVL